MKPDDLKGDFLRGCVLAVIFNAALWSILSYAEEPPTRNFRDYWQDLVEQQKNERAPELIDHMPKEIK